MWRRSVFSLILSNTCFNNDENKYVKMAGLLCLFLFARFEVHFYGSVQERPEDHLTPQLATNCKQQNDSQVKPNQPCQLFTPSLNYEGQESEEGRGMRGVSVVWFLHVWNIFCSDSPCQSVRYERCGMRLMQQRTWPVNKGEPVFWRLRRQEWQQLWDSGCVKVGCFTVTAQVTGFETVTGEMGQIYCVSKRVRWNGMKLAEQRGQVTGLRE